MVKLLSVLTWHGAVVTCQAVNGGCLCGFESDGVGLVYSIMYMEYRCLII